jgi:perosamine synthetase
MTTLGEGGMVTTRNADYASQLRKLRSIGVLAEGKGRVPRIGPYRKPAFEVKDHSHGAWDIDITRIDEIGSNFRMTAAAAAVGRVQLRKLDFQNSARQRVAERYHERLQNLPGLRTMRVRSDDTSAWHLYTCFLQPDCGVDRNALLQYVHEQHGVGIVLRYWPLHLQSLMRAKGHRFGEAPVCEKVWFEQQLNLPIGPLFADDRVDAVCDALADGMARLRR